MKTSQIPQEYVILTAYYNFCNYFFTTNQQKPFFYYLDLDFQIQYYILPIIAIFQKMNPSNQNLDQNSQNKNFISKISQDKLIINLHQLLNQKQNLYQFDCLLILNKQKRPNILHALQKKCKNIVIVDEGVNFVYESNLKDNKKVKMIVGDLDKANKNILKYYEERGVPIVKETDQNITDYEKALKHLKKLNYSSIICIGVLSDRLNHILSTISTTQKILQENRQMHILLLGKTSMMMYLHPKITYNINVGKDSMQKQGWGLITFNKVKSIETSGFHWNLGKKHTFDSLQWGNFLSTSNQVDSQQISVYSSDKLFLVGQIKQKLSPVKEKQSHH